MHPLDMMMQEHALITKLITVIRKKLPEMKAKKTNSCFINKLVDFFITYGDKTHHGKEEDILFREVGQKNLSEELRKVLAELLEEHVQAREKIKKFDQENNKYSNGDESVYENIIKMIEDILDFYIAHIEKENTRFFRQAMEYLNEKEIEAMTKEFAEFDRSIIHERYKDIVNSI